ERRVAGDRTHLLLTHIVGPTAAIDALTAGQGGQREEGTVDGVGVEPVVRARAHNDHRSAAGLLGVARELARDAGDALGRQAGDALLPGRRVLLGRFIEPALPLTR